MWDIDNETTRALMAGNCHYCGLPPSNVSLKTGASGPCVYSGIDRVDPALGYQPDNVVSCCSTCNSAKTDFPVGEFEGWILRAADYIRSRRKNGGW